MQVCAGMGSAHDRYFLLRQPEFLGPSLSMKAAPGKAHRTARIGHQVRIALEARTFRVNPPHKSPEVDRFDDLTRVTSTRGTQSLASINSLLLDHLQCEGNAFYNIVPSPRPGGCGNAG